MSKNDGVGILLKNKKNYLILHRNDDDRWETPKGHIDEGESHEETIKRELFEETGIKDFKILEKIDVLNFSFTRNTGEKINRNITYYYLLTKERVIKLSHEHNNFLWVNEEDLLKKLTFKDAKTLISNYLKKINKK